MNREAVEMIANGFKTGFPHPGDDQTPEHLIPMPGFRGTGMSTEQEAEFIGASATLAAEGAVNLIESRFELIDKGEAQQLRQAAAAAPEGYRVIQVHPDAQNQPPVMEFTIGNGDHVVYPRRVLAAWRDALTAVLGDA